MFSSQSNRRIWLFIFIDLMVVIIGVCTAFLIQNIAADRKVEREKIKVFSALKMELEDFRVVFPLFAEGNEGYLNDLEEKDMRDISYWRFVEPQYGYQIIEYCINTDNSEIIDFQLYEELQSLYVLIKQLEFSERQITEVAGQYQYLIPEVDTNHPLNLERTANNQSRFVRFKIFLESRIGILKRTSENATEVLDRIHESLPPEEITKINLKYIRNRITLIGSEEEAVSLLTSSFPNFSEEEIKKLYQESIDQKKE